jgi:hypothetical protein
MNELTCPYCNAIVPLHGPIQAGQMLTCSRCEERFSALHSAQAAPPSSSASSAPVPIRNRLSNRSVALLVVLVMGVMAAIGTTFALMTQKQRRANDHGLKQSRSGKRPRQEDLEKEPAVSPRAPLDLDALSLLPPDLDVLAGVHVALVLQEPEGRRLFQRDVPGLKGSIESRLLKRLKELTGLAAEDIDHLVVGARIKEFPPSLVLAVKTLADYEPAKLVKRLRAEPHSQARGAKVYHFRQELLPTQSSGLLNCLDERTLLLAWEGKLADVLPEKRKDEPTPHPELAALLKERVRPAGPIWLAGQLEAEHSQALSVLLGLGGVPEADRALLRGVRSFAFWMTLDKKVTIHAVIKAADEKVRTGIETSLRGKFENKSTVIFVADKEWLTLQYRPEN